MTEAKVQHGYAAINGSEIYYEIGGDGPAIIFVHAGICDLRMWDDQMPAFRPQYRVLRYDQRNYGKTKPAPGEYASTDDLLGMMDFHNINQAVLVACSMGGSLAMDFSLLHPERVRALVMIGSNPSGYKFTGDPPPFWDDLEKAWEAGDLDKVNDYEVHMWVDGVTRTPDQVPGAVREKVREMNLIALQNEKQGGGGEKINLEVNAANRLDEITVPVLILIGDMDDEDLLEAADFMQTNIANARKFIMPGTAHVPSMEKPTEFNQQVLAFLKELANSDSQ